MSNPTPNIHRKSLLIWLIIAAVVLAGIFFAGLTGIYIKLKNRPLSPIKQTQTFVVNHEIDLATMNARLIKMVNSKDGEQMVFVPAGEFKIGASTAFAHAVFTDPFWAYQTQVTNEMFARCVEAGQCHKSAQEVDTHYADPAYAQHPVVYVTWYDALQYCQAQGGRLPSEAEWEKAAAGTSGRFYPWGEITAGPELTNADNSVGETTAVGTYAKYPSYYDLYDMGGNVREWVMDWYSEAYYRESEWDNPAGPETGEKKVLKGAGFFDPYPYAQTAARTGHVPGSPGINRGFRCVIPIVKPTTQ
jgi:formylglycine-generating enzyme required for sulfatase activity